MSLEKYSSIYHPGFIREIKVCRYFEKLLVTSQFKENKRYEKTTRANILRNIYLLNFSFFV